jgi:hypothetical protein
MAAQFRPKPVFQLRNDPKHKAGSAYAGTNCNAAVGATLVALVTCGVRHPSAAAVRELTGDTSGGTNNQQIAAALSKGFDVELDTHNGSFSDVVDALRKGRGVSLSGSSVATMGIKAFDAQHGFDGNHQWALTEINDGPNEPIIRVYDPLADGRRGLALSPLLMPLSTVERFAGMLDFRTPEEIKQKKPREPLGMGKGLFSTTDVVRCGAAAAGPPNLRAKAAPVGGPVGKLRRVRVAVARIRQAPTTKAPIVGRKRRGEAFRVFQQINGQQVSGSRVWFGDREGQRWMHSSLFEANSEELMDDPNVIGDDQSVVDPDAPSDEGSEEELSDVIEDDVGEAAAADEIDEGDDPGSTPGAPA